MAKRIFQAVVLFFAIYAFVFVPLGRKTALEHIRAIVGTPAAQQAATELQGGVKRLVHRLRDEAQRTAEGMDEDEEFAADQEKPTSPEPSKARPNPSPKPKPIKLGEETTRPRKGAPERLTKEPAAANTSNAPSGMPDLRHLPDLKELRSTDP
jgi:dsDNA-specific endonuclease/ATPase MutS2